MSTTLNVAQRLRDHARARPDAAAIVVAGTSAAEAPVITYGALDRQSDELARGFARRGIGRGTRVTMMVRPSPELVAIAFALFKLGAVPVVVDPGMGLSRMLHAHRASAAEAFVGIPVAHVLRWASPRVFRSVRTAVWIDAGRLEALRVPSETPLALAPTAPDDLLVVNFTTGSTGPPKGVETTHAMGDAMASIIAAYFAQGPGDVSLATLPLFSLFDVLVGTTSVLAPMDPTRPAEADGARLFDACEAHGVTTMFASPALLSRLAQYGATIGRRMPTLRTVMSGGAPVASEILDAFGALLAPESRLFAAYGATEALPIAAIDAREALAPRTREEVRAGAGVPIGRPPAGVRVRIVAEDADRDVPDGEIGELAVHGRNVSAHYHRAPALDRATKIVDADGVWHRTGDLAVRDAQGGLWLAGRRAHVVRTRAGVLHTLQWEAALDGVPSVRRTALVGVGLPGDQMPVLCVELAEAGVDRGAVARALLARCAQTRALAGVTPEILFHEGFPVDIRHNAKIVREELASWAAVRLGRAPARSRTHYAPMLVPILGWLFVVVGLVVDLPPFARVLWWIDVFLSLVVHAGQLAWSIPIGRRAGYGLEATIALTMLLGATWWRRLPPNDRPAIVVRR